jgi:hypothetical protein
MGCSKVDYQYLFTGVTYVRAGTTSQQANADLYQCKQESLRVEEGEGRFKMEIQCMLARGYDVK